MDTETLVRSHPPWNMHVYPVTYCFVRILMMADLIPDIMNEDNGDDDPAIVIAYRLVIHDLIQLLQDQQEFRERMNG